ncbi:uncharacterized protein Dvar_02880 [Desulfosarcina variabilis str. Montpellier]
MDSGLCRNDAEAVITVVIEKQNSRLRRLAEKNVPILRRIFFRLQGGVKVACFTYSALAPTQKTGKKTSKMGYSLTEIA